MLFWLKYKVSMSSKDVVIVCLLCFEELYSKNTEVNNSLSISPSLKKIATGARTTGVPVVG